MKRNFALITGGSSGIGLAFARRLAADGWNLVLATRDENLAAVAQELVAEFKVEVETLHGDLGVPADLEKVEQRLAQNDQPVEILVNSAGFVLHDSLIDGDLKRQHTAFAVMAEAVLVLSQTAAAAMIKRGTGRIINIASVNAWLYSGNYSALKSWVVTYTASLALELRGSGVTATAVCPGETKTNFHASGGLKRPEIPNWLWCTPDQIACQGLRAAEKGRVIFVPTVKWRWLAWVWRHSRGLARLTSRQKIAERVKEIKQGHDRS